MKLQKERQIIFWKYVPFFQQTLWAFKQSSGLLTISHFYAEPRRDKEVFVRSEQPKGQNLKEGYITCM